MFVGLTWCRSISSYTGAVSVLSGSSALLGGGSCPVSAAVLNLLLLAHTPANTPAMNVSAPMRRDATADTPMYTEREQGSDTSLKDTAEISITYYQLF